MTEQCAVISVTCSGVTSTGTSGPCRSPRTTRSAEKRRRAIGAAAPLASWPQPQVRWAPPEPPTGFTAAFARANTRMPTRSRPPATKGARLPRIPTKIEGL